GYRGGDDFSYSAAFYDYWRSTNTVAELIDGYCEGDVRELIRLYRKWIEGGEKGRLQDHFIDRFEISDEVARGLWLR
ncbi:hypothetical protein ACQKCM_16785, partial [Pseudalkalibacillus hwajinpoensis]